MHYSYQLLLFASVLGVVRGTAPPEITKAPHAYVKRDDSKVTLNIGPITNYQQTTVSPAVPTMSNTTNLNATDGCEAA